jgi:hypothetical protein
MIGGRLLLAVTVAGLALLARPGEAAESSRPAAACLAKLSPNDRQFEQRVKDDLRLISRVAPQQDKFYLTSELDQPDSCAAQHDRTIYAELAVPSVAKEEWVGVSFDCTSAGGEVRRGDPLIGLFDARQSSSPARARRAWMVSRGHRSFMPVAGVWCRSLD